MSDVLEGKMSHLDVHRTRAVEDTTVPLLLGIPHTVD